MQKPTFKWNLILLGASTLLTLVAAEMYLRFSPPDWLYYRSRQVVQQTHSELSENQKLGYIPKASIEKTFKNQEFKTLVTINSKHLRDREYEYEKTDGVKRLVAMGDSFVFGWGVENHETVTEILEDKFLEQTEVLNMGVAGYFGSQQLEWLKTEGLRYQPDQVLFFTYGYPHNLNDGIFQMVDGKLYDGHLRLDKWHRRLHADLSKRFYLYPIFVRAYALMSAKIAGLGRGESSQEKKRVVSDPFDDELIADPEVQREGLEILEELKSLQAVHGFELFVIYVPMKEETVGLRMPAGSDLLAVLERYSQHAGWKFVDLTPSFKQALESGETGLYFELDDHWTVKGHQLAAESLAAKLKA